MSQGNIQNISPATWQWGNPLKCFLLIWIIVIWGYCLEICGAQSNYTPELQKLMSLGSFLITIAFSLLVQITFSHIFAYVQGFSLLSRQGIPFQAIICENSTPLRVSIACFTMLKQKQSIYQLISYLGTLMIYIASIAVGAYATSKMATPYIIYMTSSSWVQGPTNELNSSLYSALTYNNSFGKINEIQFNAMSNWLVITRGFVNEIAFMATIFSFAQQLNFHGIKLYSRENQTMSWLICNPDDLISPIHMQMDCNVTIKEGILPLAVVEYPSTNQPRNEYLSQVLLQKNELSEARKLKNDLFSILQVVKPNNNLIFRNIARQMYRSWSCEHNIVCAQNMGASTTIRLIGAILETAFNIYPMENKLSLNEWIKNSTSTGFFKVSHKVCLGGNNPMFSIGLMLAIPLVLVIIELLPLLYNDKLVWLAANISNNCISLIRSNPYENNYENDVSKRIARSNEICYMDRVKFSVKNNDDPTIYIKINDIS
ncbi:8346_t:CDS:2 [Gigaspora margarita]|uniref:8346_t:CDS:1 n=1 Tax=Gigaspora margarita TaxID=4874 RepID=A0ABN7V4E9_GIGMA|nr:8346_t:CDS:2 [Gigaspora margarita]